MFVGENGCLVHASGHNRGYLSTEVEKGPTQSPPFYVQGGIHPLGYHLSAEVGNEGKIFVDVSLSIVIVLETPSV